MRERLVLLLVALVCSSHAAFPAREMKHPRFDLEEDDDEGWDQVDDARHSTPVSSQTSLSSSLGMGSSAQSGMWGGRDESYGAMTFGTIVGGAAGAVAPGVFTDIFDKASGSAKTKYETHAQKREEQRSAQALQNAEHQRHQDELAAAKRKRVLKANTQAPDDSARADLSRPKASTPMRTREVTFNPEVAVYTPTKVETKAQLRESVPVPAPAPKKLTRKKAGRRPPQAKPGPNPVRKRNVTPPVNVQPPPTKRRRGEARHTNGIKLTKEQFIAKLPEGRVTATELMDILKLKTVTKAEDMIAVAGADDPEELWAAIAGSHPHVYLYPDTGDVVTPQHLRAFVQYLESGKTSPWSPPKERVRRAKRVNATPPAKSPARVRKPRKEHTPAPASESEVVIHTPPVRAQPVRAQPPPPVVRSMEPRHKTTTISHPPPSQAAEVEVNLLATDRSALPGAKHAQDCEEDCES